MSEEEQAEFIEKGRTLAARNVDLQKFNIKKIQELESAKGIVAARNEPRGLAGRAPPKRAGGLHNYTLLAEGCKVNVWKCSIKQDKTKFSILTVF